MNPIYYCRHSITNSDTNAVLAVLKSSYLTQGPKSEELEEQFIKKLKVKYSLAVSSGTAALHLAAKSLEIKPGDKFIVTPITFVASANCILHCGGEVEFCDIDPNTFLLDINKVKDILYRSKGKGTNKFKGIVGVDFGGLPLNWEELYNLALENNLWTIQDACHAMGSSFIDSKNEEQLTGNCKYSDISVFSLHPAKHVAAGEGGIITTNNHDLYQKMKLLKNHGIVKDINNSKPWMQEMVDLGYNYRLSDIQAALAISQLERLEENVAKRQELAKNYQKAFEGTSYKVQKDPKYFKNSYHLFVILAKGRDGLYHYLVSKNIFPQINYIPIYEHPYYKEKANKFSISDLENSKDYYSSCLSLPMFPDLTQEQQDYIIECLLKWK